MFMLMISISIIFFSMILFFDDVNFGDEVHNHHSIPLVVGYLLICFSKTFELILYLFFFSKEKKLPAEFFSVS